MGTWAYPSTNAAMDRLERLMKDPVPASRATDALSGLLGDDELFDLIGMAKDRNPEADVRPLVALTLELWANWYSDDQFVDGRSPGVAERMRRIAQAHADFDLSVLLDLKVKDDGAVPSVMEPIAGRGDYDVVQGGAPGIRVVRSSESPEIYRLEPVWGLAQTAPPELNEEIEKLFPARPSGARPA